MAKDDDKQEETQKKEKESEADLIRYQCMQVDLYHRYR